MSENKNQPIKTLKIIYLAIMAGLFMFYFIAEQASQGQIPEKVITLNEPFIIVSIAFIVFAIIFHSAFNKIFLVKSQPEGIAGKYFVLKIATAAQLEAAALLALIASLQYKSLNMYVSSIFIMIFFLMIAFFPKERKLRRTQL